MKQFGFWPVLMMLISWSRK